MPTTNRGYATPTTGTEVDLWGGILNTNFGLIDSNFGAVTTIGLTNTNVTLSAPQAACGTIKLTGTLTGNVLILFPNVQGWWVVDNQCTVGAFYVAARRLSGGNQIGLPDGVAIDILSDGTEMKYRNFGFIGQYFDVAGNVSPAWNTNSSIPPLLYCNGGTFSAVSYPKLAAYLGSTTLPDFKGRSRFYVNDGSDRITTSGSGINGNTLFAGGGLDAVGLSTPSQLPPHNHGGSTASTNIPHVHTMETVPDVFNFIQSNGGGTSYQVATSQTNRNTQSADPVHNHNIASEGSSATHNNMPPACIGGITMIRAA